MANLAHVKNDAAEEIPAYAVMRITGAEQVRGQLYLTVEKPDGTEGPHLLNGPEPIPTGTPPDTYGLAQTGDILTGWFSGSPEIGDSLGPVDDEWELSPDGSGFQFLGAIGSQKVGAVRAVALNPTVFVKPDQNVSAGKLSSPDNVFSKWKGPGADTDEDTGDDIEADYAVQDFTTADYCIAVSIGGKWYVSCFLPGGTP